MNIPRRVFLRGLGTAVALPLLESFWPTRMLGAVPGSSLASGIPKRIAWVYVPNGANMVDWTPTGIGSAFELPSILQPLSAHRSNLAIISGLANDKGDEHGDGGGAHARTSASFLTGVHPRKTAGADLRAGISVDQIAANAIGDRTRLPSLELSCDGGPRAGSCDSGYSCAYQFNISWKSETMPMTPEVDPRAAFERLFGNGDRGASVEASARRSLYRKSVLDFVLEDTRRLERRIGRSDKQKVDEYLTAVRDLERRIERAEQFPVPSVPAGQPVFEAFETYEQHMQLMYDVMALAFQTDSTRIATYIVAHDGSNRPYPNIGIRDGHHDLSHHRNDEEKKKKVAQINRYHATQFARFLERLKSTPEGEGSLLDNCTILYGSGLSDGNQHNVRNLPILVAGSGASAYGQHTQVEKDTPLTNLYRTMLRDVGVATEKVGDSSGTLDTVFARPQQPA